MLFFRINIKIIEKNADLRGINPFYLLQGMNQHHMILIKKTTRVY